MTKIEEKLVEYIDDAYAMEQNVLRMLDGMIGTTKDPQMKRSLERHKKQTEKQAERLEDCLREHGSSPSKTKEAGGIMAAMMKGVLDVARDDSPGRNARDGFATEHMEIASHQLLERVAKSAARAVLIYGETGTGKGLIARLVHQQSARASQQFIDVNCAAIPDQLLESELFGHEKGAFTGAVARKPGLIEAANGGSIFLDEIRDMNLVMQAKLLTVLDNQRLRRVGAISPVEVDVRFIAATNRILLSEVNAGRFREDLYYRLQIVAINAPPLRERKDEPVHLVLQFPNVARPGVPLQCLDGSRREAIELPSFLVLMAFEEVLR